VGDNVIPVTATAPGYTDFTQSFTVTRKLSAAEIAARQAKAKQAFIASAKTIPYNQLSKDPERYDGEHVCYRGQIFQIQEEGDLGGIMLLAVTHDSVIDFWSDNIWVDYDHSIRSAEDDVITVCGTITSTKSYKTQIGGETYVPRMHARYVME